MRWPFPTARSRPLGWPALVLRRGAPDRLWRGLAALGPGLVAAAAGNDAGGIATAVVVGATTGYHLLWAFLLSGLGLIVVQEMCARMGALTGRGLADLIRERFRVRWTVFAMLLLVVANSGATVAQLAGIAAAAELFGVPRWVAVPLAVVALAALVLRLPYRPAERVFLALAALLLAYVAAAVLARPDWEAVGRGLLVPALPADLGEAALLVTIWGSQITPYMQFFVQAAVVDKGATEHELSAVRLDTILGAIVANVVTVFVVIATAATLHAAGVAVDDAAAAARALEPLAGSLAAALFGAGLLGSALLAAGVIPLSTAYAVCEAFGWERGVSHALREAPAFYGLFAGVLGVAAVVVLWPGLPLLRAMVASQLLGGLLLGPLLAFILLLANDRRLLGGGANGPRANLAAGATLLLVVVLELALVALALGSA
ncbi:MAG TPA: Nramp family divalent metal transporter [Chloroflexota bacterium]|jgi:NRAMP (natural resistance-associated macrophage protein)-like metal ion transporter|nr:Nramp family divalent metal transporter [Chloroflexota bacterium]